MTKVKLKLPSLRSTSRDIAEDLKAIREALNVKPKTNDRKSRPDTRSPSKSSSQRKTRGVIIESPKSTTEHSSADESPTKSSRSRAARNDYSSPGADFLDSGSSRRPARQRKPNQRYTDLISETERPQNNRKRTISVKSEESEYYESNAAAKKRSKAVAPKRATPASASKTKAAAAAAPTSKNKKKAATLRAIVNNKKQGKRPEPVAAAAAATESETDEDEEEDEDEEDEEDEDEDSLHGASRQEQEIPGAHMTDDDDEDEDDHDEEENEENQFVPPPHIREDDDDEYQYRHSQISQTPGLNDGDRPKRKYIKSGKYSKKKPKNSLAPGGPERQAAPTFEAPPEFDDDEPMHKSHHRSPTRPSPMFGTTPTSSTIMTSSSARDYMDYDERRLELTSSPQQQQQYMSDGVMQQSLSMNDYGQGGYGSQQANQNYGQNQYDDGYDDGPALVYGPGPRTITYNGEYYFLSPVPPKRRCSQGPRPRSSRYKPFSANYKPPDVYRYREKMKFMRRKQQRSTSQLVKRRSFDQIMYGDGAPFGGSGGGSNGRLFGDQRLFRRPMDETDHALAALKSTIGSNDEDEAAMLAAGGSGYGSSGVGGVTSDDYFGALLGAAGGGGGNGLGGSSASGGEWGDHRSAGSDIVEPRTRGRGRGRRGSSSASGGGSFLARKRRPIEDWSARGVYGEEEMSLMDESYRYTLTAPTASMMSSTRKRSSLRQEGAGAPGGSLFSSLLTDESFSLPQEIAGDHCYIKRPLGAGGAPGGNFDGMDDGAGGPSGGSSSLPALASSSMIMGAAGRSAGAGGPATSSFVGPGGTPIAASVLDTHPSDGYSFGPSSSYSSFDSQVVETTIPFDNNELYQAYAMN